jgi:hypothetical protein
MVTCPADEWRIVTECDLSFEKEHNGQRRRIPSYAKLFKTDQGKPESQRAGLTKDEIIAIILYTGPMVCVIFPAFALIGALLYLKDHVKRHD